MMFLKKYQSVLLSLLGLSLMVVAIACTTERKEQPERRTNQLQLSLPSSTSKVKATASAGDNFFVQLRSKASWQLGVVPDEAKSWVTLERSHGEATSRPVSVAIEVHKNLGQAREVKLILRSASLADTIVITQQGGIVTPPSPDPKPKPDEPQPPTPNPKPEPPVVDPKGEHILGDVTLLEAPALAGGTNNYYITHKANGIVNFSLEYDVDRRHPRFVCFTFDDVTAPTVVKRTNAWGWDPQIPSQYSTEELFKRSGYDRGHLVASHDRVYSREANQQTFYYSNMSPQLPNFNQKYWSKLEKQVQDWGRNKGFRDILYVAKGGTIRDDQVEGTKVKGRIVVPKYYWMAMVVKKGNTYHGIAFWLEHKEWDMRTPIKTVTLSIDALEEKLGINLFHNFPDEIEKKFEAEDPANPSTLANWPGI